MTDFIAAIEPYKPLIELVTALGSFLAILTWLIAIPIIINNWLRGRAIRLKFNLMGVEAAASFAGAAEQWAAKDPAAHPKSKAGTVARTLSNAFDANGQSRLAGKRILWVDDDPASLNLEIQGFEALGANVISVRDTDAALKALRQGAYDLVISDMGRPPDMRAGYTLLDAMRHQQITTPFLIYSGSKKPEHVEEAKRHGAAIATNDPEELLAAALRCVE